MVSRQISSKPFAKILLQDHLYASKDDVHLSGFQCQQLGRQTTVSGFGCQTTESAEFECQTSKSGLECQTPESGIECQTSMPVFGCQISETGIEGQTPLSGFEYQTAGSGIGCQTSMFECQTTECGTAGVGFECQTTESGFDLLSDEQATSLLLSMDAETLLECGR